MPEWIITAFLKSWLVAAFLLFVGIVIATFRPGSRATMERNARIPFVAGDETDGQP